METFPCPGCAEPMPVSLEVCPACRRPRSEAEVDVARAARAAYARHQEASKRRLLVSFLALLAAGGVYAAREKWLPAVRAQKSAFDAELERTARLQNVAPVSPAAESAVAAAVSTARAEAAAAAAAPAPAAPAPRPPSGPAKPMPEPPPPQAEHVRLYGVVYDLETLSPVYPVRLFFDISGFGKMEVGVNEQGHWQTDILLKSIDEGVTLTVRADGYLEGALLDDSVPYLERTQESRLGTLAETTPADLGTLRVPNARGQFLEMGLALVPAKKPAR